MRKGLRRLSLLLAVISIFNIFLLTGCNKEKPKVDTTEPTTTPAITETGLRQKSNMDDKYGVYYEIFIRAFADSDGDGIGDFVGATKKLDYLKELGVDGIWLMPVNESDSYHGYDITDYNKVNSDYGTEEDFKNFLAEAKKRDIKVIMDFVINHTGSGHPWFVASKDPNSEYRDYYQWRSKDDPDFNKNDTSPWGSKEWHKSGDEYYFAMFWDQMPDLNYDNPKVREEIKTAAKKWLELGVDGFRLDAAMHIYGNNENKHINQLEENLNWWNEFAIACQEVKPDVYLVGESWQGDEALEEYAQPFDTKFDFAFEENLMRKVTSENAMYSADESFAKFYEKIINAHYEASNNMYIDGVFGTNHDQDRIMSQVFGDVDQAKLVANVYMTVGGNPYIYYGEELGMEGEKPDENIREPFPWSEDKKDLDTEWMFPQDSEDTIPLSKQINDKDSLYNFYKNLIAMRKSSEALSKGKFSAIENENRTNIMSYSLKTDNEEVYVYHNFSGEEQTLNIEKVTGKIIYSIGKNTTSGEEVKEYTSLKLSPYGSVIINIEK